MCVKTSALQALYSITTMVHYLFNAMPDTNHNANSNCNSKVTLTLPALLT